MAYYVNPNIKSLYRTSYKESRANYLRLDMNENPEGLPNDFFKKVIDSFTPEHVAMYPEMANLTEKLAQKLKCNSSNICLTNGSDDAIRLLFEVFGESGKQVVSVSPSFEMYSVYTNMYGMIHSPVKYNEDFEMDIESVVNAIGEETGIVVLLNPNSPIGKMWLEEEVRLIIEKARKYHSLVVIDEAYYHFSPFTFLHLMKEYDNLLIFRTFSKIFSIAGCRIGYVISNENIINELNKASSTYPVNCFAIKFAENLLEDSKILDELISKEKEGSEYLISQLKRYNYKYYYNYGNYILIKSNTEPQQLFNALKQQKILVKTYTFSLLSDWIRVTTGSIDTMKLFWEHFIKVDQ